MWDPAQYLRYGDERARPFLDLLARVGATGPRYVVDLGCGPGGLTASLLDRWPGASVDGVDNAPEMIEQAAKRAVAGRLAFGLGDVRDWRPPRPVDVLVANATLQWVPGHITLLPQLVAWLAPGGWFAMQVPGNFSSPSHTSLRDLRLSPRWRHRVGDEADRHLAVGEPAEYVEALAGLGCRVDVWETTYTHVLPGDDAVLEWMRGTGLRPVLARLDEAEQEEFLAEYGAALRRAYPRRPYGIPYPFRRIFAVAARAA
ncbi:MAG: trans-aconitate 2-methyltransferase [Carbonactinosporaceae bacterium]